MQPLDINVAVLSIVFLLIAVLCISSLKEFWRTAKSITATLHMLNESLPRTLRNLEEITTNINMATLTVKNHIENITPAVKCIQGMSEMFIELEHIVRAGIRHPFFKTVNTITAVLKGGRAFLDVYRTPKSLG
jgi:uncharacterized protein YoxC